MKAIRIFRAVSAVLVLTLTMGILVGCGGGGSEGGFAFGSKEAGAAPMAEMSREAPAPHPVFTRHRRALMNSLTSIRPRR